MTTDVDVTSRVKGILTRRIGVTPADIRSDARLVDDLNIDSLDKVELLIAAEREFAISLSEDAFHDAATVEDVVAVIESMLVQK
jgi:acyl carrier protein